MKTAIIEVNPLPTVAQVVAHDLFISHCLDHGIADAEAWAEASLEAFEQLWEGIPTSLPIQTVIEFMVDLETDHEEFNKWEVQALAETTKLMVEHYGQ